MSRAATVSFKIVSCRAPEIVRANGAGIGIESTSRCEMTGCRVSGFLLGIASFGGSEDDAIIHNFVTNCKLGLSLSRTDCYQSNVATGCTKAFSTSGIENGHN